MLSREPGIRGAVLFAVRSSGADLSMSPWISSVGTRMVESCGRKSLVLKRRKRSSATFRLHSSMIIRVHQRIVSSETGFLGAPKNLEAAMENAQCEYLSRAARNLSNES